MDARKIIAKIRDKVEPTKAELAWFARGLASGEVTDAQAGAFAMAVLINGMSDPAKVDLTLAMRDSGDVLRWDLPGPVLDKHSTGGVGDCVSLILAPALAACGAYVPMISGRGLGHTGGTLDKLEAIAGLNVNLPEPELRRITRDVGCAIVSATGQIAPADKRLYGIRDVSGSVASIDLITSSILSKKLAAGLEGLVLDVKAGSGALMKSAEDAAVLARSLVDVANGAGCPTAAFVTDMNEPLAPALGNALEVGLCMEILEGNRLAAPRLHDLSVALGGRLLALAGGSEGEGEERVASAIATGEAMEHFAKMVSEMGGSASFAESWKEELPGAPVIRTIAAEQSGHVSEIDGETLGTAVVDLGGGRRKETDTIDPSVGIDQIARLGRRVESGEVLCRIHAADNAAADRAEAMVRSAILIGEAPQIGPILIKRVD